MSAYGSLARWYDALTGDVPYEELADAYEALLHRDGREKLTLLDLACGTGTLSCIMAQRGHEMICADVSPDMLAVAREKAESAAPQTAPIFLCQEAAELDLYGTVEGAYCSLDAMNYIPPEELAEVFHRLHLFIEPEGVFAFDFQSPERLRALDGGSFSDEEDGVVCLWRGEFDEEEGALYYSMDIFSSRPDSLWERRTEEHIEYAHTPEALTAALRSAGFRDDRVITDGVQSDMGRLFISAVNGTH
ncbi:MAG: methyltransferase domain-containing protein [Oscillospiraceae bacterium]|nr:methyltransferase domain-containing protein [Oscillospiraceae bacterium]